MHSIDTSSSQYSIQKFLTTLRGSPGSNPNGKYPPGDITSQLTGISRTAIAAGQQKKKKSSASEGTAPLKPHFLFLHQVEGF
jgi:hypothetical protein